MVILLTITEKMDSQGIVYNKQRQANIQHFHICTKSEYLFSHQEYLSKCTPTHHCYIITFIWYQLSINVMLFSPLGFQNKQTQVSILQKWGRFDGLPWAADCQINIRWAGRCPGFVHSFNSDYISEWPKTTRHF